MKTLILRLSSGVAYLTGLAAISGLFSQAMAANFIERDGKYEINWSAGKVRFYGVGKFNDPEENLRAAEQRAWADGLAAAEQNIPILMSGRLGLVEKVPVNKLTKLAASTISVSTTYFGDNRIKVLLEAPIEKITPQLVNNSGTAEAAGNSVSRVVIKLPRGVKPSAFVQILDEHGREMVGVRALVASANSGAIMSRWFKNEAGVIDGQATADMPSILATSPERGVIRIAAADWKPAYGEAVVRGAALFVVQ